MRLHVTSHIRLRADASSERTNEASTCRHRENENAVRHRECARDSCHSSRLADCSAVGADRAKAYGYALYCGRDARYVTALRRLRTWSYTHVRLTPSAPRMHAYTHAEVQAPQTRPSCAAAHMRAVDGDPDQSVARKRAATAVVAGKASPRRGRRRLSRIISSDRQGSLWATT